MEHRCRWRGDTPVINPTSIEERLGFYRQIHRPVRSDREPLSFGEVTLPFPIQLLSKDDWAFAVRSTALEQSSTVVVWRGDTTVRDPTSIGGRSGFCRQIHRPGRSDRTPSSFVKMERSNFYWGTIGPLPSNPPLWVERSGTFIFREERSGTFVVWRGDIVVSDPTSIGGRSDFCHQIQRTGRSDRVPSSFGEVILPSAIQLLSGDDRAFVVRSIALIHRPGRSDRTPSSFGEVILSLVIQLLSGDDRAFVVRSTALIHRSGRSNWAPSSFGEVILLLGILLLLGDDQAFAVKSTVLVGVIGHLHRHLLGEAKVELHRRHPLKATTY
ncbi:hypothetical protein E5676_scaffold87G00340 [Cucumis melo var. makuwa]|uniref:Uncharacterized protein n=1 Tax=Cucumis melo var. makuwa TaxID=1194695 RepID=A0A5D3CCC8_CUCMM|nr:hypothetical protein E5676_scaffold87G00340 [Cucumis melo var. makuwa]